MNDFDETSSLGAVAIIGMTGRFPDAVNVEEFWENLRQGKESVRFFTHEELIAQGLDEHLLDNPKFVAADAILEGMDLFDAAFFDYSAREAEIMDPQHRMFLEAAWEALEKAGYDSESYGGRIAIYAGSALSGYMLRNLCTTPGLVESVGMFKIMIANSQDFLATRVSYKLNLRGPSMNVNTLCSSSMVGVYLAYQSLLNYNCDIALAGGVSFQISRNEAFFYQEGGIGAADGHCRAFDARANGTVSGSGLGIVVLKRLEDALADGDTIYAIIRGAAVNNDGSFKNSFTAPNMDGQAVCIAEALAVSGVNPETITYVETHGTGTNLGDPIEVAALTKAFRAYTSKKKFCGVGSVKTNIGHLVTAGGVASLIKTVLAMQHRQIPPSLNFEIPNPKIDFDNSPFYVVTKLTEWKNNGGPLRAGVSSFGIGGTNSHVIVEEAPQAHPSGEARSWQLVTLSARTDTALETMTRNLAEYVKHHPDLNLADIAFTRHVGRRSFNYRRMVVCKDTHDLVQKLEALAPETVVSRFQKPKEIPVVFVFPGDGFPYVNVGVDLYRNEPVFREEVERCAAIFKPELGIDLSQILYPDPSGKQAAEERLKTTKIKRAIAFTISYALANLWRSWGIEPAVLSGAGTGEIAAACLAKMLSLEDAALLLTAPQESIGEKSAKVSPAQAEIPLISSVTGERIYGTLATEANYWTGIWKRAEQVQKGLSSLLQDPEQIFIEMGAGEILNLVASTPRGKNDNPTILYSLPTVDTVSPADCLLLHNLGLFWLAGGKNDWYKFYAHEKRRRLPLPTYPFERQRYWIEPGKGFAAGVSTNQETVTGGPKKLEKKPRPELENPYLAPRNEVERIIAERWQEVLGFDKIGIYDDFFDLGGHSLLAAAIASSIGNIFGMQLPLTQLLEYPTIASLAEMIENYRWAAQSQTADTDGSLEEGEI